MSEKQTYPSIDAETRPAVPTDQAAYYLGRREQTLRKWACYECGPIRPARVFGRLMWPMEDIRRLLGVRP